MHLFDKLQTKFPCIKFLKYLLVFSVPRKQDTLIHYSTVEKLRKLKQKIQQAIGMGMMLIHEKQED